MADYISKFQYNGTTWDMKDAEARQALASCVNNGYYDSNAKKIILRHDSTTIVQIDATDFIKDGMVSNVQVVNGYLVITFNTDAGQEPIRIPITDIFNPDNYYTKSATNGLLALKQDLIQDLAQIRQGASAGATSYQKPQGGIPLFDINQNEIDNVPTNGSNNLVRSGGVQNELALGAVYDVSAHNNSATFASLQALLSNANIDTLIPTSVRKGGMSIKFVQSSDNKYVQYRLMADTFSTIENDWQGVDATPQKDSHNLVESGGIKNAIDDSVKSLNSYAEFTIAGILNTNGKITSLPSTDSRKVTDFTKIIGDILMVRLRNAASSVLMVAFYSSNNEESFINGFQYGSAGDIYEGSVTIPENANYYRAAIWPASNEGGYFSYLTDSNLLKRISDAENQSANAIIKVNDKLDKVIDANFVNDGFITVNRGTITSNQSFKYTDFIYIKGATEIKTHLCEFTSFVSIAFYDISKVYISSLTPTQPSTSSIIDRTITIPESAYYVRFSNYTPTCPEPYAKVYFETKIIPLLKEANDKLVFSTTHENLYPHILNKPFNFNGKNVVAFGDSITYGVYSVVNGSTVLNDPTHSYIKILSDKLGFSLDNRAVSSTTICNQIKSAILNYTGNADYIIIAGGTNDFNQSLEIGTFDTDDTTKFYGALKAICEHLQTNCPDATIIFITPLPYTDAYFNKLDQYGIPYYPYKYGNLIGKTLNDYRNAIYQVATEYGYSCINGGLLGMPEGAEGGWNNIMCSDNDGCHPTILGHQHYANSLLGVLM